jgi:hypothetical protein
MTERAWVEIHTFTERNGPELNGHREGGVPDGIYVPESTYQGAVWALEQIADGSFRVNGERRFFEADVLRGIAAEALAAARGQR